jgi:hypothetical protein
VGWLGVLIILFRGKTDEEKIEHSGRGPEIEDRARRELAEVESARAKKELRK